jgi:rod shape-determining protein MreD
MKSILIASATAILMLFIQSTWLSHGIVLGIIPDLAMSVLLFSSFINKNGHGIIASFIVGIVADMLSASPLGHFAFLFSSCAYLATLLSYVTEKDLFVIPFLLGSGATIVMGVLSRMIALVFSANIHSYQIFSAEFGVELVMNGLFTGLIFFLLSFVQRFFEYSPRKALP